MKIKLLILLASLILMGSLITPARAQTGIRITNDQATIEFPETITFSAEIKSGAQINSVILEYGADQLTCGTVIAEAFPTFTPSTDVTVSWTWNMRQSTSQPPGAKIWWRWQVKDANGGQYTSTQQTITWLDNVYDWQVISGQNVNLHWYNGSRSFGNELHDAAAQAIARLTRDIGVSTEQPIDLYIYASPQDMQTAILYEPSWTGGRAFAEQNIVIIGIGPDELEWGKSTEAHELTHVLIGHMTFTCLGFIPHWLSEGVAVYGEGGPDAYMQEMFDSALASDDLFSVRSLTGNFPEASDKANLAYGESYSIVQFLISQYGRQKMTALLLALRDGNTADQALQSVYGFDVDGLEDAWRANIGAPPRAGTGIPTPLSTPTFIPTFMPISGAPLAESGASPVPVGTEAVIPTDAQVTAPAATPVPLLEQLGIGREVLTAILFALVGCTLVVLIIIGLIVFVVRRQRRTK